MGRRVRAAAVVAKITVTATVMATLAACGARGDQRGDEAAGPPAAPQAEDAAALEQALAAREDLDQVVTMAPGGVAPMPEAETNRSGGPVGARHVLRADGPAGPIDLFEYRTRRIGDGDRLWLCRAIVAVERTETPCSPDVGPPDLIGPVFALDRRAVYVLVGPADTTHFVAEVGGRRLALIAVDAHALLVVAADPCTAEVTVEAWRDDVLLDSDRAGFC